MIPNPNVELETQRVLGAVSRALDAFGGDVRPEQPPVFAADRGLEDDLGRGYFGSATMSAAPRPAGGVGDLDEQPGDDGTPSGRR